MFRNRNLYVTVKSRDVCAALVALFRGGPSHGSSPATIEAGPRTSEDGEASARTVHASLATPPASYPSTRVGRVHQGRRSEGAGASIRTREQRSSVGATARNIGSGGRSRGGDNGESDFESGRGRPRGSLKRSASDTGRDCFASTSSSDDELLVPTPLNPTPPLSGTSGRSPVSTHSSESPDPIMRSRMVGFGSADLEPDVKPKRGRSGSFKNRWARRNDNDRSGTANTAAATTAARQRPAGLAVEGKASTADVGNRRIPLGTPAPPQDITQNRDVPSPVVVNGGMTELLRRPASAPSVVDGPRELSPTFLARSEDAPSTAVDGTGTAAIKNKPRMMNSPLSGRIGKPAAASPKLREGAIDISQPASQQLPLASPLQTVEGFSFAFPLQRGSPRRVPIRPTLIRKELGNPGSERKIPPLRRPIPDEKNWAMSTETSEPAAAVCQDSTDESSVSPMPRRNGRDNGNHRRRLAPTRSVLESSSYDSLDEDGPYGEKRGVDVEGTTSDSEEEIGGGENGRITVPAPVTRDTMRTAPSRAVPVREPSRPGAKEGVYGSASPPAVARHAALGGMRSARKILPQRKEVVAPAESSTSMVSNQGRGESGDTGSMFGPETFEAVVSKLTIEADSPHAHIALAGIGKPARDFLPFSGAPAPPGVFDPLSSRSRGSQVSYGSRGSRGTECTSPDSPPGGAVGEVRASIPNLPGPRSMPIISGSHVASKAPQEPKGPSGFEELWAVLEPAWGINSSFGTSMTPKVMLLGEIYDAMRNFQAAVANVCVRACGPALGEVCGRCGRAWAVLSCASPQSIADFPALHKIEKGIGLLITIMARYETGAVIRRFTLSLIQAGGMKWDEMLSGGEGADLQGPCRQIEDAIALLPTEGKDGKADGGSNGSGNPGLGGGKGANGRGSVGSWIPSSSVHMRLPPCPSYWAKGQFDRLTPGGLPDVLALLHEPARFAELARLVTRASDEGAIDRPCSPAWDCVRQAEGPALSRALRHALSATLVAAGEFLPLPRVPPPPRAFLPRERLASQIEATILHPFLPLGIAGIGGASGSGKTVLAAAVVREEKVRRRFGDRVFWVHAGKGASGRLLSIVQSLADTVYAWLTDSRRAMLKRAGGVASGRGAGGGSGSGGKLDAELREPVRFRHEDQAVQYVADLCQGPLLAGQGLRCLVVLDDVHERSVVKSLWKSQCQLLVITPVPGFLGAVGAEATMAEPFDPDTARKVAAAAAGEDVLCDEGAKLVELCRGCPLAVAMSGALAQTVIHAGAGNSDWRTRGKQPRGGGGVGDDDGNGGVNGNGGGNGNGGSGGGGNGDTRGAWSLGIGDTLSTLTGPVGEWVEKVVGGAASPSRPPGSGRGTGLSGTKAALPAQIGRESVDGASRRTTLQGVAWTEVAEKVDVALAALESNTRLRHRLVDDGPEEELPVRAMLLVLTQVSLFCP